MTDHDPTEDQPLQLDGAIAVATDDRDELHTLCVRTLAELLGAEPDTDEDGDIAVPVHGFVVYVTVADDGPQLHVWSSILAGITDHAAAAAVLVDFASDWPRLRFTFSDDHLLISTILDADPFAPQHLINLVDEIHEFTDDLDDEFAARFNATLDCDADDDSYAGGLDDGDSAHDDAGDPDATAATPAPTP